MSSDKARAEMGLNAVIWGHVKRQTKKAYLLVEQATEREVWVPKSQADYEVNAGFEMLYIPAWLAKRLDVPFFWA